MTIPLASDSVITAIVDALRQWPWSTIVSVVGAIVVALITRSNQRKADEALGRVDDFAQDFNKAVETLDNHFNTQSDLLKQAITGLTTVKRGK